MRPVKPITLEQVESLYRADQALRNAIRWTKQAEAPQTLKRLRRARSSLTSAIRHARRRFTESRRDETPGPQAFSAGWLRRNPEAIAPAPQRRAPNVAPRRSAGAERSKIA